MTSKDPFRTKSVYNTLNLKTTNDDFKFFKSSENQALILKETSIPIPKLKEFGLSSYNMAQTK